MTGMDGNRITGVYDLIFYQDAATRSYVGVLISSVDAAILSVDNEISLRVAKVGDVMSGTMPMGEII